MVELHLQITDFLCVLKQTFQCHPIDRAQEVLAALLKVQAMETGLDITWRTLLFDMASCTLGD